MQIFCNCSYLATFSRFWQFFYVIYESLGLIWGMFPAFRKWLSLLLSIFFPMCSWGKISEWFIIKAKARFIVQVYIYLEFCQKSFKRHQCVSWSVVCSPASGETKVNVWNELFINTIQESSHVSSEWWFETRNVWFHQETKCFCALKFLKINCGVIKDFCYLPSII